MTVDHRRALWGWFLERAQAHDEYGYVQLDQRVVVHLMECGIDYASSEPPTFGNASRDEPPALMADSWRCHCGGFGHGTPYHRRDLLLAIPGPIPLLEIITGVAGA